MLLILVGIALVSSLLLVAHGIILNQTVTTGAQIQSYSIKNGLADLTVRNTGSTPAYSVTAQVAAAGGAAVAMTCTPTTLTPGESASCTAQAPFTSGASYTFEATLTYKDGSATATATAYAE